MILSGATSPGQCEPGSDGNEGELRIPQNSNITGTLPSDCLVSYTGHSLRESYLSAKINSVHSAAPADWTKLKKENMIVDNKRHQSVRIDNSKQYAFKIKKMNNKQMKNKWIETSVNVCDRTIRNWLSKIEFR